MKRLLLLLSLLPVAASAADKPMNILALLADDWRYDTLGCAGNPVVKTPQLAEMRARFAELKAAAK